MINLESVFKYYHSGVIETTVLNNITLDIKQGEFVAIMGPSGCGKSTLLNVIGLLDSFKSGSYKFLGQEMCGLGEGRRSEVRKKNIGFIFQNFNLIDEMSVIENVQLAFKYHGYAKAQSKEIAMQKLEALGVSHRAKHFPKELSGGQQQRVAIARAVAISPSILLADEPTGNLDSESGLEVMCMLNKLNEEGTTLIMVTHSNEHAEHAGRIMRMSDGKIVTGVNESEDLNLSVSA